MRILQCVGLTLRCAGETKSFSCINMEPISVDWKYVATENMDRDNIRVCHLKATDTVSNLLDRFGQEHTKAVVFISYEDHLNPPCNLLMNTKETPYPLVMVKKSDGAEILSFMKKNMCPCGHRGSQLIS